MDRHSLKYIISWEDVLDDDEKFWLGSGDAFVLHFCVIALIFCDVTVHFMLTYAPVAAA
jgi:hypothetical protein